MTDVHGRLLGAAVADPTQDAISEIMVPISNPGITAYFYAGTAMHRLNSKDVDAGDVLYITCQLPHM